MQWDGNLVLYRNTSGGRRGVCWATHTLGRGGVKLFMQYDMNLVMYGGGAQVIWASNSNVRGSWNQGRLQVQDDGNAVIYLPLPNPWEGGIMQVPFWATNTDCAAEPPAAFDDERLRVRWRARIVRACPYSRPLLGKCVGLTQRLPLAA